VTQPLRISVRLTLALAALLALAGCEGGGTHPGFSLVVETEGFVERGSTVTLSATMNGQPVDPASVTFTVAPADAATLTGPATLRFLREGRVTVTASAQGGKGSRTLDVPPPPTVVFDRVVGSNRDLWKVELDGGNLQQLTTDPAEDADPTVAQGKIVFVSYRGGGGANLWQMPLAGGAAASIVSGAGTQSMPALSPDGQRLAYISDVSGVAKLWTANGDGSNPQRATSAFGFAGSIEASPSWAPAGSRLAFTATATGNADVWDFTIPGTPVVAANGPSADVEPAWSPDGASIAFSRSVSDGNTEIFLLTLSSGAVTPLTDRPGFDGQAAWTADGRIVYTEWEGTTVKRLRWLDPAHPGVTHPIDTGPGEARFPAPVR
jgi:Tol biopolymer transport system component